MSKDLFDHIPSALSSLDKPVLDLIRQIRAAPRNALRQNPDSPVVSVFADWLISRGDPRGEFIASRSSELPKGKALESLERYALDGLTTSDVSGCGLYFNCGFLTALTGASSNYADFIGRVSRDLTGAFFRELSLPLESLEDALATRPLWPKTQELNVSEAFWGRGLDHLPILPGEFAELETINFLMMGSPSEVDHLPGLVHQISAGLPRLDILKDILVYCPRYSLEGYDVAGFSLDNPRARQVSGLLLEVASAPAMAGLECLSVGSYPVRLRPGVLSTLLRSPHLRALQRLDLNTFLSSDDVAALLVSGPPRPNLTKLAVCTPERPDDLVPLILGESPVFTSVSTLVVRKGSGVFPLKALELLLGKAWVSPLRNLKIFLGNANPTVWEHAVELIRRGLGRQLLLEECSIAIEPATELEAYDDGRNCLYEETIAYSSSDGSRECRIRVEHVL